MKPGEQYSEAALQAFQARLQDTGYFSGVEVSTDPGEALDEEIEALEEGATARPKPPPENPVTLPVLVRVTENKQRNVALGLGFSSNTGARAQVSYDDLNVRGLRMKSNVIMETRRQGAHADFYYPTTPKGYNDSFGASFERNDVQGEVTAVARGRAPRLGHAAARAPADLRVPDRTAHRGRPGGQARPELAADLQLHQAPGRQPAAADQGLRRQRHHRRRPAAGADRRTLHPRQRA
ncbi:hypothetical protein LP420_15635 [Massilia sp. B-10]|nr:hypothetical protein LP420_15635 [Massilia sp. B-10]